ncbi:hypothetical protein [uncultured Tateyamaria sp.]|uniref:hypothetical protein n=1 Tax=uncultured Tateyamaria sp. TaxID=455651 RepID=UPI00260E1D7A|nr:hypothetical protein [uncultured Tateyamaria sp.]
MNLTTTRWRSMIWYITLFSLSFAFFFHESRPAFSKSIEEYARDFVAAVTKGETWDALAAFSGMSDNVIEAYAKVSPTQDIVERFVDPIELGLAAFSGDAVQLKEFQSMLEQDIAHFKKGYRF